MPGNPLTNERTALGCPRCGAELWYLVSTRTHTVHSLKCLKCSYYVDCDAAREKFAQQGGEPKPSKEPPR